jgi:hypothetical protein
LCNVSVVFVMAIDIGGCRCPCKAWRVAIARFAP